MENTVSAFISKENLIAKGQTVCVAVSGGCDSTALLHCLLNIKEKHGFNICALHFEHGIRGRSSLDDANLVSRICRGLGVKLYTKSADVPALAKQWSVGIETAAKRARETFFDETLQSGKADLIATAHHADDNLESVLMHIIRGCGTGGLIGIRAKKQRIIRPLLCVEKKDITSYVRKNGIEYSFDQTNLICDNARNYLRNVTLPQIIQNINPNVSASAARLSKAARDDEDFIQVAAKSAYKDIAAPAQCGLALNIAALNALHPAVKSRVLRMALNDTCGLTDIESAHIDALAGLAKRGTTGKRVNIIRGVIAETQYDSILLRTRRCDGLPGLTPEGIGIPDVCNLQDAVGGSFLKCDTVTGMPKTEKGGFSECFDGHTLRRPLTLRTRRRGDRIRPLGAPGYKKLKDYFIDKKIPRDMRDSTPLLADGSNILWVVGHTISHDCRVSDNTKEILMLRYTRKD